ncbi:NlpC/P60 family protein [Microterricola gilva]|uniref:NlpC/P60 family protein n=1 Tax=Microterricola gilva TaxID=393267 RepID=A0A4Q8AJ63_9MICO|nr:NlpC/P60 family protein [Microterricola gilva]
MGYPLADPRTRPLSRVKPVTVFSAVTIGAMAATVGLAGPVAAAPDYPSWDDIQNAKKNEATKKAEIDKITGFLDGLRAKADAAMKQSLIASEAWRTNQEDLAAATGRESKLKDQQAAATKKAETSKMRAGLLASHLARSGGQDMSINLFLEGDGADDLLRQLGAASKLSEQSQKIYDEAIQDSNTVASLAEQARAATTERERLAAEAQTKLDAANALAQVAVDAYDAEQRKSDELYAQLAVLRDSTAQLERERVEGERAEEAAKNPPPVVQPPAGGNGGNGGNGGSTPTPQPSNPAVTPPVTPPVNPPVTPPVKPPVTPPVTPPVNSSAAEQAISFALAQLGDRYVLGGAGPDVWDCSGLTRGAYGSAGVWIGTHSATNQYRTMAAQNRLVPFSDRQRGDLIFWTDNGGGDYYHVAIYLGNGRIVEAPNETRPVREYFIWGMGDVASYVGRPG